MSFVRSRRLAGVLTVAMAAGVGIAGTSSPSLAGPKGLLMDIQILSFNDFHGNLEAPSGSSATIVTGHALSTSTTGVVSAVNVNATAGGESTPVCTVQWSGSDMRTAEMAIRTHAPRPSRCPLLLGNGP